MKAFDYKKVIIDPNDPRIEIGKLYYMAKGIATLKKDVSIGYDKVKTLKYVDKEYTYPFHTDTHYNFSMMYPYEEEIVVTSTDKKYLYMTISGKHVWQSDTLEGAIEESEKIAKSFNTTVLISETILKAGVKKD